MIAALLVALPARSAHAVGWNARLELGFGGPLERPQRGLFAFAPSLWVGIEPVPFLDIHLVGALVDLHPSDENPDKSSLSDANDIVGLDMSAGDGGSSDLSPSGDAGG